MQTPEAIIRRSRSLLLQPAVLGWMLIIVGMIAQSGCSLVPDFKHKPQYHNPFPQISRIAVLPFRNQSEEPTLSGFRVSQAYYNELQSIPGFEILPLGVIEQQLSAFETNELRRPISSPLDFQQFARFLGVDAVIQGAVTDYSAYYPPRMTLKVNWYAANPGFHPIPAGYGLPWGTKKEKKIPEWIRLEAERSLAREQLKTQSPDLNQDASDSEEHRVPPPATDEPEVARTRESKVDSKVASARIMLPIRKQDQASESLGNDEALPPPNRLKPSMRASEDISAQAPMGVSVEPEQTHSFLNESASSEMPADWPDPQGFIPASPKATKPEMVPQYEPIISHMKAYNGNDEDFTEALGEYFYYRDDARFGGWQAYLQRSEDFIRFCCHQHVIETLASRGGQLESRMILRWPISRYER